MLFLSVYILLKLCNIFSVTFRQKNNIQTWGSKGQPTLTRRSFVLSSYIMYFSIYKMKECHNVTPIPQSQIYHILKGVLFENVTQRHTFSNQYYHGFQRKNNVTLILLSDMLVLFYLLVPYFQFSSLLRNSSFLENTDCVNYGC